MGVDLVSLGIVGRCHNDRSEQQSTIAKFTIFPNPTTHLDLYK